MVIARRCIREMLGPVRLNLPMTRHAKLHFYTQVKSQTFTGVLKDNCQVKMKDGSMKKLKPSGIPKGARISIVFQAKTKKVNRQQSKVLISLM